jgi:adenylate kinase family enzyme
MKITDFPIFKTKIPKLRERFDINDPAERKKYFRAKVGPEIVKLHSYLEKNTFLGFLLGKKNSGKGTYSKLFMEAVESKHVGHVSVGDIVRDIHAGLSSHEHKSALIEFLKKNYRGFHSVEETIDLIEGRDQSSLISTELIIALLKYEISKRPRQAIFMDGFPRGLDQISYSLFLRELIGYREDPDFLAFISVPNAVIDERIKFRVICPICKAPRNLKLFATKDVGYDEKDGTFYLMCDTPSCNKARMVRKEGDELGIEPIRKRLEVDDQVFRQLLSLHGIPKVFLRNSIPVQEAKEYVDDYELTPAYSYELDKATGKVRTIEKPWVINDDEGISSYSLLPPAVVVSLIKQTAEVLGL